MQEPSIILRFYASLAFATDEQLGYDSTIKRVRIGEDLQYEIKVGSTVYQTVSILSDFQASCIIGKANRTWQVVDKEKGGESLVLKDIWLVRGASREYDIWRAFVDQVESAHDKDDDDVLHKHFVPVETGWCVEEGAETEDIPEAQITGIFFTNGRPASQRVGHHYDNDLFLRLRVSSVPKVKSRRCRRSHWRVLYKSAPLIEFDCVKHIPTMLHTLEGTNKGLHT